MYDFSRINVTNCGHNLIHRFGWLICNVVASYLAPKEIWRPLKCSIMPWEIKKNSFIFSRKNLITIQYFFFVRIVIRKKNGCWTGHRKISLSSHYAKLNCLQIFHWRQIDWKIGLEISVDIINVYDFSKTGDIFATNCDHRTV